MNKDEMTQILLDELNLRQSMYNSEWDCIKKAVRKEFVLGMVVLSKRLGILKNHEILDWIDRWDIKFKKPGFARKLSLIDGKIVEDN